MRRFLLRLRAVILLLIEDELMLFDDDEGLEKLADWSISSGELQIDGSIEDIAVEEMHMRTRQNRKEWAFRLVLFGGWGLDNE